MEIRVGWECYLHKNVVGNYGFEIMLQGRESAFLLLLYQHHMVIVPKLSNVFASNLTNQGTVDDLRKLLVLTMYE